MTEHLALLLAPGLTLGAVIVSHDGAVGEGIVAGATSVLAARLLTSSPYLPYLPVARVALLATGPALGAAAAVALLSSGGLAWEGALTGLVAAWLILALGLWVTRVLIFRKVRVAVLSPGMARALTVELREREIEGYEIVGWIGCEGQAFAAPQYGEEHPCLGEIDEIRRIVVEHRIDLLVSCPVHGADSARVRTLSKVAESCLDLPVRLLELSQLYELLLGHVPIGATDAAWFETLLNPRFHPGAAPLKRSIDVVLGTLLLLASLPVLAAAAVAIKVGDRGPVLHHQVRVGQGRRLFTMLKLRTMRPDAEAEGQPQWSREGDERTTWIGRMLRTYHVDELPQLWNVIRGDMSLVGPRPERPGIVAMLEERYGYYRYRHLLKPGITGWGQVRCGYAGSEVGAAWKLCHDLYYLEHRSTYSDLLIMIETLRVVATGSQYGLRAPDEHFIAPDEKFSPADADLFLDRVPEMAGGSP